MKILRNIKPGFYELSPRIVNEYFKNINKPIYAYARIKYAPFGEKYQFERFDLNESYGFHLGPEVKYSERDLGYQTDFDSLEAFRFHELKIPRDDVNLIKAAEVFNLDTLETVNCKLEIVEIPDDVQWEIKEISANPHYMGGRNDVEKIIEKHREW